MTARGGPAAQAARRPEAASVAPPLGRQAPGFARTWRFSCGVMAEPERKRRPPRPASAGDTRHPRRDSATSERRGRGPPPLGSAGRAGGARRRHGRADHGGGPRPQSEPRAGLSVRAKSDGPPWGTLKAAERRRATGPVSLRPHRARRRRRHPAGASRRSSPSAGGYTAAIRTEQDRRQGPAQPEHLQVVV